MAERKLTDLDGKRSRIPFKHRGYELGNLREDQIPRFLAALTDPDRNTVEEDIPLADLRAIQNRVDTANVEAMAALNSFDGPLPVVVVLNGDHFDGLPDKAYFIADGHHRAAAAWLRGDETVRAKVKDLREPSNAMKSDNLKSVAGRIIKTDDSLGLALGWAIVSTENGSPYFDVQDDHIPADVMTKAASDFMSSARTVDLQHSGLSVGDTPNSHGSVVFAMPWTAEIAKAFGIDVGPIEGLMIGIKPDDPAVLTKFRDGSLTGFSIGGKAMEVEDAP